MLHHSGWSDTTRIRGASSLWNGAEIGIFMESDSSDADRTTISFKKWRPTTKRRPRPIDYSYNPEKYTMMITGIADYITGLKPALPSEFKKQIMELTGVHIRQATNKFNTLMAQDHIYQDKDGIIQIRDNDSAGNNTPQSKLRGKGKKHLNLNKR